MSEEFTKRKVALTIIASDRYCSLSPQCPAMFTRKFGIEHVCGAFGDLSGLPESDDHHMLRWQECIEAEVKE